MKLTTFTQVVLALSLVGAGNSASAKEHSTRGEVQMRHRKMMAGQTRDNLELGESSSLAFSCLKEEEGGGGEKDKRRRKEAWLGLHLAVWSSACGHG
jgi:hypothetical protein